MLNTEAPWPRCSILGKDLRTDAISKAGSSERGLVGIFGVMGR